MGISLIHDLSGLQLAYWLGPALAITGVLLVTGLLLEAKKFKVGTSVGSWFWLRSKNFRSLSCMADLVSVVTFAASGLATSAGESCHHCYQHMQAGVVWIP